VICVSSTDGMADDPKQAEADLDTVLIARWQSGDDRAATALVRRHAEALARFAVHCGVRDDIDELVQDTFVRAFNALESFRADSSFRTWLFTILRRLVLDRRRAQRRRPEAVEVEERDAVSPFDALDGLVAAETARRVRAAVDHLTPLQRDVFTLRVTEGLSYKEIAAALDTTEGAARVHYHNAIKAVKEALRDD
jgi:RNA polymerase sigma-70 factor (ECF subfamily)